jgi:transcriptional regulator with GAF, ATPase, and Fis domain
LSRDRWFEIAEILSVVTHPQAQDTLCARCRDSLSVAGATISLMTDEHMTSFCVSDESMAALESLQFTLGEGPTIDAFETGHPVLEPGLQTSLPGRWPRLASLLHEPDVDGVFAFPLQVGAARIGVLTLYQKPPDEFSLAQHADAFITADVLSHVILARQANARPEMLAKEFQGAASFRAETHQASGMLSEQAQIGVAAALALLRSRAYATDRPIARLAAAVIEGTLRVEWTRDLEIEWITEE